MISFNGARRQETSLKEIMLLMQTESVCFSVFSRGLYLFSLSNLSFPGASAFVDRLRTVVRLSGSPALKANVHKDYSPMFNFARVLNVLYCAYQAN